jgi:hypothetical protein
MDRQHLEKNFSSDRLSKYFQRYPNDEQKAIYLYEANLKLSQALYIPLSVLEVALRNKVNAELIRKFRREDWYAEWYKDPLLHLAWRDVINAINQLHKDGKAIQPNRVIASLMFGFWTSLFNDQYDQLLWRNLRFVFSNMPHSIRQRRNVSKPLNNVRKYLRNRIYHNEPIIFNITNLENLYQSILSLQDWMGADIKKFSDSLDSVPLILKEVKSKL